MQKEELIKKAYDLGFEYEKNYRGCSQCAIAAIQDALNVRNDWVFKSGSGLATGLGLLGDGVCGGYSGGVMVMSTFFGRIRDKFDGDREEKYCSFGMAVKLHDKFMEEFGTITCKEIHKLLFGRYFDLWNPDEKQEFENMGAHKDKCTTVVAKASAWATELILEELENRGLSLDNFKFIV